MLRCGSCTATLAFLQCGCHFDQKLRCSERKTAVRHWRKAALQESGAFLPLSCGFQAPTFRHPRLGPADPCRATRVALHMSQLISWDFIAFCRCSTGVALHPLNILVSHLPPPCAGRCRTEIWVWKGAALHGGVAATVAGVALHCATKPVPFWELISWFSGI